MSVLICITSSWLAYTTILLTVYSNSVVNAVRLLDDSYIPPTAIWGKPVRMRCSYDLEGNGLYSVKWYFNKQEFYRYMPSDQPPVTVFSYLDGVKVNRELSTEREVVLENVGFNTSGQYRCEVSGDAPTFQTASMEALLQVVAIPQQKPDIIGARSRYRLGDRVNVTCNSRGSRPAARLTWWINGEKADENDLIHSPFSPVESRSGLMTSKLGLNFLVRPKHFRTGELKLKCTATINTVYWQSAEESVQGFNALTASISEGRNGKTSAVLQFLLAAATSQITGGVAERPLFSAFPYILVSQFGIIFASKFIF